MLAFNKPIGRFIALANLEKDIIPENIISQRVSDLVDLITIRVKEQPIEDVSESLLERVFDLRYELIEWLVDNNKDFNFILETINENISVNLQLAPYSELAKTITKVLMAYEKILSPIASNLPISMDTVFNSNQNAKLSYGALDIFSNHPLPQIRTLKDWMDASLKMEMGLILSDLVLTEQVKFSKKRVETELIEFLYSSITKFGAYSIFTGFWKPAEEDDSKLTNRMQILCGTIELDNQQYTTMTKDDLMNMLN